MLDTAARAALGLGAEGDRPLAGSEEPRGWRAVHVMAALGRVNGTHSGAALRTALASRGLGTSDPRCASLLLDGPCSPIHPSHDPRRQVVAVFSPRGTPLGDREVERSSDPATGRG